MRYASLASGSKGNCHAISDGERTLLIDAGITLRQIGKRLGALGWSYGQVRGVAITHEHTDHIDAVPVILGRTDWTILATPDTLRAVEALKGIEVPRSRWTPLKAGRTCDWEGWRLHPFALPHDTVDPVAYRIEAGGVSLAVITDLGCATALAVEYASGLELLGLESNHDGGMLREGTHPPHVQARILSRVGHLSNDSCAGMLDRVVSPATRHIVLAHLSEQNNDPALARLAAADVLGKSGSGASLHVASQGEALEVSV
jgi:phosphoribosyl 1,2-cyclic phosphodiesterase